MSDAALGRLTLAGYDALREDYLEEQRELRIEQDFRFYRLIASNSTKPIEPGALFPSLADIKLRPAESDQDALPDSADEMQASFNAMRTVMEGGSAFSGGKTLFS